MHLNKIANFSMALIIMLSYASICSEQKLPTVDRLDIKKYSGKWYEIAKLPNKFEKNLTCVTATYKLNDDDKINVINRGYDTVKNKYTQSEGVAWRPNHDEPGQIYVRFFWPFKGKYWVMELDEDYSHVLIGSPSRKYLWILARNDTLDTKTYNSLLQKASALGFDTNKVTETQHGCKE